MIADLSRCAGSATVDFFDEQRELFRRLGLSEEASLVAATGRYRSEREARGQYAADEAETLAETLIERRARGEQLLAEAHRAAEGGDLTDLPLPVREAALAVRDRLGMSAVDARWMATRLFARESRRGGAEHAERFVATLAMGLRRPVREAASW